MKAENYENIAVHVFPEGIKVSKAVFDAIKRIAGYAVSYSTITDGLPYLYGHKMYANPSLFEKIKTPNEILGKELMCAIEQDYTPWFEGDPIPEGDVSAFLADGYITKIQKTHYLNWSASSDGKIIAYKKTEQSKKSRAIALSHQFNLILSLVFWLRK